MRILHLTADFPDPLAPSKTRAVANLLALAPEHEHRVCSLNRVGWRHGMAALDFDDPRVPGRHRAVTYGAPPKGVALAGRLAALADWLGEDTARAGFRPDLVHAHKLTIEGLAGLRLAEALGVPLVVSSQGNTDLKLLGARPDLRRAWARVWHRAAAVLPFAPWTAEALSRRLGPRAGPVRCLPCPTPEDGLRAPRVVGPHALSAFHLAGHANKNAGALIDAVAGLDGARLDIVGGGDAGAFAALSARIAARGAGGRIRLLGPRAHREMPALFNGAALCAIPARRESYAMALAEALMAGCPVLFSRGTALDGYLEEARVSLAIDPGAPGALADALARMMAEEADFKRRLAEMQAAGGLERFRRGAIAETYRRTLCEIAAAIGPERGAEAGARPSEP